jgi:hypothetical protein
MISPDAREVRLAYPLYGGIPNFPQRNKRPRCSNIRPKRNVGYWAVKPISRWQWNDGYGADCGPSQAISVGVPAAHIGRPAHGAGRPACADRRPRGGARAGPGPIVGFGARPNAPAVAWKGLPSRSTASSPLTNSTARSGPMSRPTPGALDQRQAHRRRRELAPGKAGRYPRGNSLGCGNAPIEACRRRMDCGSSWTLLRIYCRRSGRRW